MALEWLTLSKVEMPELSSEMMEKGIKGLGKHGLDIFSNCLLQAGLEDAASTDAISNVLVTGTVVSLNFRVAVLPRARADGRRWCCRAP